MRRRHLAIWHIMLAVVVIGLTTGGLELLQRYRRAAEPMTAGLVNVAVGPPRPASKSPPERPGEWPPPAIVAGPHSLGVAEMGQMEAHILGDGLIGVSGDARVWDKRDGYILIWLVRVYGPDAGGKRGELIDEYCYADRAVVIPAGDAVFPIFADVIPAPAVSGSYHIELILLKAPADYPLDRMPYDADLNTIGSHLGSRATVTVP
jgi:hypothetical protein